MWGVGRGGVSRCYWHVLSSVWKPPVHIDSKSLLLALRNKQKMKQPFPPSIQDIVSQMQNSNLIKKYKSIIHLPLLLKCGCWCFVEGTLLKGLHEPLSTEAQVPRPCVWQCPVLTARSANEWIIKWLFNPFQQNLISCDHCYPLSCQWVGFSVQWKLRIFLFMQAD